MSEKAYLSNDLEVDVLHCTGLGFLVNFVAHVVDVVGVGVVGRRDLLFLPSLQFKAFF